MEKGRIEVRPVGKPDTVIDVVCRTVVPYTIGDTYRAMCRYRGTLHIIKSDLQVRRECLKLDDWLESLYIEVEPERLGRDC